MQDTQAAFEFADIVMVRESSGIVENNSNRMVFETLLVEATSRRGNLGTNAHEACKKISSVFRHLKKQKTSNGGADPVFSVAVLHIFGWDSVA